MSSDTGSGSLDAHFRELERLLARTEQALAEDRLEEAAVRAQVSASFAWLNHTGVFACERLEAVLQEIGRRIASSPPVRQQVRSRSVLHVATQVYPTGGHTQMLANWIRQDRSHRHELALVAQGDQPLPKKVGDALEGRPALRLDDHPDSLVNRAQRLRRAMREVETVVLHVHPHDVVPALALADEDGPTVWFVNHADHVFWVGAGAAHRIVNLRESGARLNVERRGVGPGQQALLIRPVALPDRTVGRAEAKRRLGVAEGLFVVASAAAGSKYEPIDGVGFLDVLEPLLARRDDVRLLVAGPSPDGRWAELERRGRGRALGLLPDAGPLLDAADIYVDSFPVASLTSMLEAAGRGVPVVSLRPPSDEPQVLGADTPELDEVLVVAESAEQLCDRVGELLDDGRRRSCLGSATRESMARNHGAARWADAAGRLLDTPVPADADRVAVHSVRRTGVLDERVRLVQAQVGISGTDGALLMNAGLLQPRERWGLALRGLGDGRRPTLPELLGTRWTRRVRARRRVRP